MSIQYYTRHNFQDNIRDLEISQIYNVHVLISAVWKKISRDSRMSLK